MAEPDHVAGRLDARYRAFLETVGQLRPKLHRYCTRMVGSTLDGEDVVQEALFDAYRRLDTYADSRPAIPSQCACRLHRHAPREYPRHHVFD
jgi:RNA polymerase sigma-70 factor (ECF subfamily)